MTGRLTSLLAAALALAGCSDAPALRRPTGQIVFYVTSDAPLPPGPGKLLDPSSPPALFDRLRLDVFAPGAEEPCSECSRDFELTRASIESDVESEKASIGIVPPPGVEGYVVRARLFRFLALSEGEPPAISTIDSYVKLPAVEPEGITRVTLELRVDDLGSTRGSLAEPLAAAEQLGEPNAELVGTWAPARRVPCAGEAGPGEACVPGGAFWMGHPYARQYETVADVSTSHLVVLSPFFVDLHEVTVADFRAFGAAEPSGVVDPLSGPDDQYAAGVSPVDDNFFCTYSREPLKGDLSREELPLNCVSWQVAGQYCEAQGKRLPSEAELEYLGGALRSALFVWGQEPLGCSGSGVCQDCDDSVWGRANGTPGAALTSPCGARDEFGAPLPPGSGKLDRLMLNGREVVDLMGNVSEWTRDFWNRNSEQCWSDRALLENPECQQPSAIDHGEEGHFHTVKGQGFARTIFPAATRSASDGLGYGLGFRCVRQDAP